MRGLEQFAEIAGHRLFALVALGETVNSGEMEMHMQNEEQRNMFKDGCVPPRRNPVGALVEAVLDAVVRLLTGGKCSVNRFPDGPIHAKIVEK